MGAGHWPGRGGHLGLQLVSLPTLGGVAGPSSPGHQHPLPGLLLLALKCCPAPHVHHVPAVGVSQCWCHGSVSLLSWPSWVLVFLGHWLLMLTKNLYRPGEPERRPELSPGPSFLPPNHPWAGKLRLEKAALDTEAAPPPVSLVTLVPAHTPAPSFVSSSVFSQLQQGILTPAPSNRLAPALSQATLLTSPLPSPPGAP